MNLSPHASIMLLALLALAPTAAAEPGERGACCLGAGPDDCQLVDTEAECDALGGTYLGPDTTCDFLPCRFLGACCLSNFSCVLVDDADCLALGGDYQGDGVECSEVFCVGACCLSLDTCIPAAGESFCDLAGGTWLGEGTGCGSTPCAGLGACCFDDGSCALTSGAAECAAAGGTYQGDGVDCSEIDCLGACCVPGESCTVVSLDDCMAGPGVWQGLGTDCDVCTGACCNVLTGSCLVVPESQCASLFYVWSGYDTDCATTNCPGGACCLTDGSCTFTSSGDTCLALGGLYHDNASCAEVNCAGACCFIGNCMQTGALGCTGSYYPGLSCDDVNACGGACCSIDGTCTQTYQAACIAGGGTFHPGLTCAEVECPLLAGACCLGDEGCMNLTPEGCAAMGGCFASVGELCATYTCPEVVMYADAPALAIPDEGSTSTSIVVPDSGALLDVNVELTIDHTWIGDLCVTLEHGGTTVDLVQRPGADGGGDPCHLDGPYGCNGDNYAGVVLDDAGAGGPIEGQCADDLASPPSYVPNEALAALRGLDAAGTWTLTLQDRAGGDTGTLQAWSIVLTTCSPPTCPADLTGPSGTPDGNVDALDFLQLIAQWGSPCTAPCTADITGPTPGVGDGNVDSLDFLQLIAQWGSPGNCP